MQVLEDILGDAQPGYESQVLTILQRIATMLGPDTFEVVEKDGFSAWIIDRLDGGDLHPGLVLQTLSELPMLAWWCGLPLGDAEHGAMTALARRMGFEASRQLRLGVSHADPAARTAHAVFVGALIHPLHSPTRGAFEYVEALVRDPAARRIEVYHSGTLSAETARYGQERFGPLAAKVRFVSTTEDPNFLMRVLDGGACTFHFWCESAFAVHVSLLALLGPTVMFMCGDAAPVQFADVYWSNQDRPYIEALWRRQAAPEAFLANYQHAQSACYAGPSPHRRRSRAELGFGPDEVVVATAGNRLGVDMTREFVDGMGELVRRRPEVRWLVVGQLQEFWVNAFGQVLGPQFRHIPYDEDLGGLFPLTDIFANPFRAGGGYSAAISIQAGAPVMTLGSGDVRGLVPLEHLASNPADYFERLDALVTDQPLRAAWAAAQETRLAAMFDQERFAEELKGMTALAYERFAARLPARLEAVFAQGSPKRAALRAGGRARLR